MQYYYCPIMLYTPRCSLGLHPFNGVIAVVWILLMLLGVPLRTLQLLPSPQILLMLYRRLCKFSFKDYRRYCSRGVSLAALLGTRIFHQRQKTHTVPSQVGIQQWTVSDSNLLERPKFLSVYQTRLLPSVKGMPACLSYLDQAAQEGSQSWRGQR